MPQGAPVAVPTTIPYEKLGRGLLDAADRRSTEAFRSKPVSEEAAILRRLEPLHQRVRLGGIELWIPLELVKSDGRMEDGMSARAVRPLALDLIDLERRWIERANLDPSGALNQPLASLEDWVRLMRDARLPEQTGELTRAAEKVHEHFQIDRGHRRKPLREYPAVLILAPNRAHYLAVLGAAGLTHPQSQVTFWSPNGARSLMQPLYTTTLLLALAYGPMKVDGPPFENHPLATDDTAEYVVHTSGHLLAASVIPSSPDWLWEGLALVDTIRILGEDETVCTGHRDVAQLPTPSQLAVPGVGAAGSLVWISRDLSPYRGGPSARFFRRELGLAHEKLGFEVLDLSTGMGAGFVAGPFLGPLTPLPDWVVKAPDGVRRGFAEFFRAYCAAFTVYLETDASPNGGLLELALTRLKQREPRPSIDPCDDLAQIMADVSGKTLGTRDTPELDLEAAFVEWLERAK